MSRLSVFVVILLMLCHLPTNARQNDKPLDSLVAQIGKVDRLDYNRLWAGSYDNTLYKLLNSLNQSADFNELLNLLDHEKGIVKGFAVLALVSKKYPFQTDLYARLSAKPEHIDTQSGYIVSSESLHFILYDRVYSSHYYLDMNTIDSLVNRKHLLGMDSIMLHTGENRWMMSRAYRNNRGNEARYEIIRKLALESLNADALISLASFQKPQDVDTLMALGPMAFETIAYFPDQAFKPYLEKVERKDLNTGYFNAIAAYKDEWSVSTLQKILQDLKQWQHSTAINQLRSAITQHHVPAYDDLVLEVFEHTGAIDSELVQEYLNDMPDKLQSVIERTSVGNESLHVVVEGYGNDFNYREKVMGRLLEFLRIRNSDRLLVICQKHIATSEFLDLEVYTDFVRKHKLRGTAEALLDKFKTEQDAFDTYHISRALLSFNEPAINRRLQELLKETEANWNRRNWSKAFVELFDENDFQLN